MNITNPTLETILTRRSIRSFKEEQIAEDQLQTILEAGLWAPSAMNQQPWHFTVVQNKEMLSKINEACRLAFLNSKDKSRAERTKVPNFQVFHAAPTLVVISADEAAIAPAQDSALALSNIMLAAHSIGVGSCWIHALRLIEDKALLEELKIPANYKIYGSAALGYAQQAGKAPTRKEGTVHYVL